MNIDNTIHNLNVVREALEAEGLTQHVRLIDEAIVDLRTGTEFAAELRLSDLKAAFGEPPAQGGLSKEQIKTAVRATADKYGLGIAWEVIDDLARRLTVLPAQGAPTSATSALADKILASKRRANHPCNNGEPGKRLVGWIMDEDVVGLSEGLFAIEEIERRARRGTPDGDAK